MKSAVVLVALLACALFPMIAHGQKTAEDYVEASQNFLQKRDLDRALKAIDKAIELNPDLAPAYNYRSSLHLMRGDLAAALKDLDQALLIDTDLTLAYVARGQLRMVTNDMKGALNDFDNAIARGYQSDEIFGRRGAMKMMLQNMQGALQDYNTAISMNPNRIGHYLGRATARSRLGDEDGALSDYTYVIEAYEAHIASGKTPKARITPDISSPIIKGVERPSKTNPRETVRIDSVVAMNPEAERTMTSEQMEYLPNVAGAYLNRALILGRRGDSDAALADLNKSISVYPHFPAYIARAKELEKRGDVAGALADLTESIEMQPGSALTYLERGTLLMTMGKDEEAEKDFSNCLKLSPTLAPTVEQRRTEAQKRRENSGPKTPVLMVRET